MEPAQRPGVVQAEWVVPEEAPTVVLAQGSLRQSVL